MQEHWGQEIAFIGKPISWPDEFLSKDTGLFRRYGFAKFTGVRKAPLAYSG
jgi:hypothetical protein